MALRIRLPTCHRSCARNSVEQLLLPVKAACRARAARGLKQPRRAYIAPLALRAHLRSAGGRQWVPCMLKHPHRTCCCPSSFSALARGMPLATPRLLRKDTRAHLLGGISIGAAGLHAWPHLRASAAPAATRAGRRNYTCQQWQYHRTSLAGFHTCYTTHLRVATALRLPNATRCHRQFRRVARSGARGRDWTTLAYFCGRAGVNSRVYADDNLLP